VSPTKASRFAKLRAMADITLESLEQELALAEKQDTLTIPGTKLRALLEHVAPIRSPQAAQLNRMREIASQGQVVLTAAEVRLLRTFAGEIQRRRMGAPAAPKRKRPARSTRLTR
jgi:hypothetical protein